MKSQCYLPPETGDHARPQLQPDMSVFDLPALTQWKVELTLVLVTGYGIHRDGLPVGRQSPKY